MRIRRGGRDEKYEILNDVTLRVRRGGVTTSSYVRLTPMWEYERREKIRNKKYETRNTRL